ncbi:MAG: insulinase family protein, partial [Lachnospiraceae bacterium]|nr:insulinase family protein [Lachnospiraceae bacterium]
MAKKKKSDASVVLNWLIGDSSDVISLMEGVLLSEILLGHDGASLSKALVESKLGEDISPVSGLETELRYMLFSAGLRGIEPKKAKKLEKCVFSVLKKLAKKGIPQEDVDAAIFSIDFSNREIKRSHGPYSLVLMRRILQGWLHGKHPAACLDTAAAFQVVKEKIAKEGQAYLKDLIKKRFLENTHRTLVT